MPGSFVERKRVQGIIAGTAASRFGAGLTTLVVHEKVSPPAYLMHSTVVPENCTALAIGMGLGDHFDSDFSTKTCYWESSAYSLGCRQFSL